MDNTSTALIPRPSREMVSYKECRDFAVVAATSRLFLSKDVTSPEKALALIMIGRELGLRPAAALRSVYIIEGLPTLSARLMTSLINTSGYWRIKTLQWSHSVAEIQFLRLDEGKWEPQTPTSVFTVEDAKRAKYVKPNGGWEKTPKNMLWARALSNGFNIFCPELANGMPVYAMSDEEIQEAGKSHYSPDPAAKGQDPPEAEWEPLNKPREAEAGSQRISQEQAAGLLELIRSKDASLEAIKQHHKIQTLEELTVPAYEAIIKVLEARCV